MRNYIAEWSHGEDSNPQKQQVSARVDIEIVAKIDQLAGIFGVSKTSIIEGALDVGTDHLLSEMNLKDQWVEVDPDYEEAKADYEEAKREFEDSKGE